MAIIVKNLSFTYSKKTPYEKNALKDVNLTINDGDFVGIIGHTGSGKSTFIQHINGLIKVQSGTIEVFDMFLHSAKKPKVDLKRLRSRVGMVFQYPEYQLFEENVEKDIAFGAKNLGMKAEDIPGAVKEAMELVGLDYETYRKRSPFDLSGGEKRRVAIAGVIVMKPEVLILDEPTAGLDPKGKENILNLIKHLKETCSPTVIVVSHDIDEISSFANRIIVFGDGTVKFDVPMNELFSKRDELEKLGLDVPVAVKVRDALRDKGIDLGDSVINEESLVKAVIDRLGIDRIVQGEDIQERVCLDNDKETYISDTFDGGDGQ